jgi:putative hemolysin
MKIEDKTIITEEFINIEKILENKNPRLLKIIPGFVLNYLKKVIHLKELNSAIYRNRDKYGVDFVNAILEEFQIIIKVNNKNNLPETGRYIVATNHPLGGLDGLSLMKVVGEVRKDLFFPINDLLMNLPGLRPLAVPINKHGLNFDNIDIIEETFASDSVILFFPAGLCSRKTHNKIMDLEWKKTFISKAKKHKRDIIPAYIDGRNSNFFYNLANLRKKLGIKSNIEMLYLVDEMYKQKDKTIIITFGEPISYKTFDNRYKDNEWAKKVKEIVYGLNN